MKVLAIDPGQMESAIVVFDTMELKPKNFCKADNRIVLKLISDERPGCVVIEKIASYGMPVGVEIFDTVFWSGIFALEAQNSGAIVYRVERRIVKNILCNSSRAKDSNIIQELVDRFAPGVPNHGKGSRKNPGFYFGFFKDIWQAWALAVAWHNILGEGKAQDFIFHW